MEREQAYGTNDSGQGERAANAASGRDAGDRSATAARLRRQSTANTATGAKATDGTATARGSNLHAVRLWDVQSSQGHRVGRPRTRC